MHTNHTQKHVDKMTMFFSTWFAVSSSILIIDFDVMLNVFVIRFRNALLYTRTQNDTFRHTYSYAAYTQTDKHLHQRSHTYTYALTYNYTHALTHIYTLTYVKLHKWDYTLEHTKTYIHTMIHSKYKTKT